MSSAFEAYLADQKKRRQRLKALVTVTVIILVLLWLMTCQEQHPDLNSSPVESAAPAKVRRRPALPRGQATTRNILELNHRDPPEWLEEFHQAITKKSQEIHTCLDAEHQPNIQWSFRFNPQTGEIMGSSYQAADGTLIEMACLDRLLLVHYQLRDRGNHPDQFHGLALQLYQTRL